MAYDTDKMIEQCLKLIKKHKLTFIEDVTAMTPFHKRTFYDHKLHECDAIKTELEKNKAQMKRGLRVKWYNNDNATTQIALYRLLADADELDKLSVSKHQVQMTTEQPLFDVDNKPTDDPKE
jgi:hypothetical protein